MGNHSEYFNANAWMKIGAYVSNDLANIRTKLEQNDKDTNNESAKKNSDQV